MAVKKGPAEPAQVRRELKGLESSPADRLVGPPAALSMGQRPRSHVTPSATRGWCHMGVMSLVRRTALLRYWQHRLGQTDGDAARFDPPGRGRGIHARASLPLVVHVPDSVGTRLIATLSHTSLGADVDHLESRTHRAVVTRLCWRSKAARAVVNRLRCSPRVLRSSCQNRHQPIQIKRLKLTTPESDGQEGVREALASH